MSHQPTQIPPKIEMRADKNGVYVAVQGTEHDSLDDCVHAAHAEMKWMWDRDGMAVVEDDRPRVIQR
ncbi:hypothetical protein [Natrinema sp. 1APR25-10V2]|uniref:hypothetical protein n=1 Tax=Natrinema sp. 1APR25-10V2 TaxID=2951081 RepID=UPI002875E187|nr:hypothetical protein [Natrinema sp. 1APR25-10V2]MDS0474372.1 hypothetical protein [Natrinema sp. 1APR25-10V2]